jgi:hypothetical protein
MPIMSIISNKFRFPPIVLSAQDKTRLKKVAIHSSRWIAAAIAVHILLPVPGKALCTAAGTILLSGIIFVRYSAGDYLQVIPHEYPKMPHIVMLFATMVQPYSAVLGLALSAGAGTLYGFYFSRLPIVPMHEMVGV